MIFLQALVNGLVSGTLLAVPAIGFTAMFAVLRFPNFSVSGVATLGAFAGYLAYGAGLQMAGSSLYLAHTYYLILVQGGTSTFRKE